MKGSIRQRAVLFPTPVKLAPHGLEREFVRIRAVARDGQGIILELSSRGEGPSKQEIRFTDKTLVVYNHVPPSGAKLTERYFARVRLEAGSDLNADKVLIGAWDLAVGPQFECGGRR